MGGQMPNRFPMLQLPCPWLFQSHLNLGLNKLL